jgi:hypothetical protein
VRRGRGRDTISDDVLALELSDEVWIGLVSYRKKESGARAFKKKMIVRHPEVVKGPPVLPMLEIYPALILGENTDRALVIISRPGLECGPKCDRKCRTIIEVGVLRESETSVVIKMAEVQKNVWQLRSANERL